MAVEGRESRALYLLRRAALSSRQKRSARGGICEFPKNLQAKKIAAGDFSSGARCAFVATKAQRASCARAGGVALLGYALAFDAANVIPRRRSPPARDSHTEDRRQGRR